MMSSNTTVGPEVSVIIPVYNCEEFIGEAIESALSQDYSHKEIIVVDDGSQDGTVSEVRKFGDRVRLLQQKNGGPAAARNQGARVAYGQYLAFLDGDDVWLPGKLSAQVQHITDNPDVGVVYGSWCEWYPTLDGGYPSAHSFATGFDSQSIDANHSGSIYPLLLLDSIVCTISVLMPRTLFERLGGFDQRLRRGEDYDFWIRLSREVLVHKLSMVVALYRMHQSNTTRRPATENYEYLVLSEALHRYGPKGPDGTAVPSDALRRRLSALCFQHGYMHFRWGSPSVAAEAFSRARDYGDYSVKTLSYTAAARIRCLVARRKQDDQQLGAAGPST
jgi:glycosyltransferase involved in cell wall biosynthesis